MNTYPHRQSVFAKCLIASLLLPLLALLAGCGDKQSNNPDDLFRIVLQTDWYAQPEHGGFYQALVNGYYAEEGLDVDIIPGGPNSLTTQRLAQGNAQFAIGRSDDVIISVGRGLPLVIIGAFMQKDPQAIMFHKESGITGPKDLHGRSVMTVPGSAFLEIMRRQYGIEVSVIPLDYGMNRFLADKNFIQQCFITNEPFYVARAGANVGTFLLSESGFNPYRVWFTSRSFLRRHPDKVAAFHRASIRGWQSYLSGDRSKANAMIASRNPKMDDEFMAFSVATMIEKNLITGDSGDIDFIGTVDPARILEQIQQLEEIGMIDQGLTLDNVFHDITPSSSAEGPPSAALAPAPASALPILNFSGRQVLTLSGQDLANHRWQNRMVELETAGRPVAVRGLPLLDLLAELNLPANWDFVLANCNDGYQSNWTRDQMRAHVPFLVLEVEGMSTAQWAASMGSPQWGPFIIQTLVSDGLLEPVNKNPWGVTELRVGRFAELWPTLSAHLNPPDPNHMGLKVFIANCASCHQFANTAFGGTMSARTVNMLGMLARYSEPYFRQMLIDPAGTNILAQNMPPATHLSDYQVNSLIQYLAAFAHQ